MQTLGYALLALSFVATLVGYVQRRKGKKILSTPFRKTGEVAAHRAGGDISCEGVIETRAPVVAPCSGTPCLYYEIELVQEWTKQVMTEDGVKEERGHTTISTGKGGTVFYVNDGSGPVGVDPRHGMDVELEQSFEDEQAMSFGQVTFGQFQAHVPPAGDDKCGRAVRVVERIVPANGKLFVLGRLDEQRNITPTAGLTGSLIASRKGRSNLLGATKRNATIGFVAGALFMLPGGALAAMGEPTADDPLSLAACKITDESVPGAPCTGKIFGDYGSDVTFEVTKAGTFQLRAAAPVGKRIPLVPKLDVKDASGRALVTGGDATVDVDLAPGTYTVNIQDSIPGAAKHFKGGFSYELSVKRLDLVPAVASTPAAAPTVLPISAVAPDSTMQRAPLKGNGKAKATKGKKARGKKTAKVAAK